MQNGLIVGSVIATFSVAGLTLLCAFWYPRTVFGNLLLLAGAYLMAENFAFEETPRRWVPIAVAIPFLLGFVAIAIHAAVRRARNADARLWASAGMSGAFYVWQSYTVTGRQARLHWTMRVICSILLALFVTAGFAGRLLVAKRVSIDHLNYVISELNKGDQPWQSWPSPEMKSLAGQSGWGTWRPKEGDVGTIVWWMEPVKDTKYFSKIYVLEVRDEENAQHYVPITSLGFTRIKGI